MSEFEFEFDFEEWKDVTPISQDDGPNPVVAIAYCKECMSPKLSIFVVDFSLDVQLMGLFRAVLLKHELSERVLDLTTSLLDLNAANYTVWYVLIIY